METVSDILEALGGPTKVAEALNRPDVTPRQWRRRGNIPTDYWPDLITLGKRLGKPITADALLRACTAKPVQAAQ